MSDLKSCASPHCLPLSELLESLSFLNSPEYDWVWSDDPLRYCTEEEKHKILRELGFE